MRSIIAIFILVFFSCESKIDPIILTSGQIDSLLQGDAMASYTPRKGTLEYEWARFLEETDGKFGGNSVDYNFFIYLMKSKKYEFAIEVYQNHLKMKRDSLYYKIYEGIRYDL